MLVEPRRERALPVALLAESGQRDDQRAAHLRQLAEPADDFISVHRRQPDVEQDHVRRENARLFQGGGTVMGDAHVVPVQSNAFRQRHRRIHVVVDDQHAPAMRGGGQGPDVERRHAFHGAGDRHGERRAIPEAGALHLHRASVQLHQPADERKADPEAALGVILGAGNLDEGVEERRQRLGRDADAAVANTDFQLAVPLARGQIHAAAIRRVLDRVGEQVAEDLLQPHRIRLDHQRILREGDRQLLAAGARHRRHRVRRLGEGLPDGKSALAQFDLPAADPRDVEQLVDDPHHVPGLALDDGQLALDGAAVAFHHLESGHHGSERIA